MHRPFQKNFVFYMWILTLSKIKDYIQPTSSLRKCIVFHLQQSPCCDGIYYAWIASQSSTIKNCNYKELTKFKSLYSVIGQRLISYKFQNCITKESFFNCFPLKNPLPKLCKVLIRKLLQTQNEGRSGRVLIIPAIRALPAGPSLFHFRVPL